jgi:hypothetical protein
MTDTENRRSDFILKLANTFIAAFGALGVVASIFFGFSQLEQQSAAQTEAIKEQWNSTFYDERIKLYTRATEAAARIASLKHMNAPAKAIDTAIIEFRNLFWGPMCITEGPEVESAMVKFNIGLSKGANAEVLQQLALLLAHVCKNETYAYYLKTDEIASVYGSNREILTQMDDLIVTIR